MDCFASLAMTLREPCPAPTGYFAAATRSRMGKGAQRRANTVENAPSAAYSPSDRMCPEAIDLDQQRVVEQRCGIGQGHLDKFALLQIVAPHDKI